MTLLPAAVTQTMSLLCALTVALPIGTNLGLLRLLWMQVSGALLPSRGALFPALQAIGLAPAKVRQAWAALRYGRWESAELLAAWNAQVKAEGVWQPRWHGGYRAVPVDLTGYWRPSVQGLTTKHYNAVAGKALPAVVLGLIGSVGEVAGQRLALLTTLVRAKPTDTSETELRQRLVQEVARTLAADEIAVLDAGFPLREVQAAGLTRYVVRLPVTFTARRNVLPPAAENKKGRPAEYGQLIRPLARTRKGKELPATAADRIERWTEAAGDFRAEFWDKVVRAEVKVQADNVLTTAIAIYDPRFSEPWLLACPLPLSGQVVRDLFRDRWPIEQIPLAGKQMLGGARQFVFAPESRQRLPELNLLAGNIVTYLAATLPAAPTGFWDRQPRPTPGRLRRRLERVPFPETYPLPARLREKASVSAHLPKGILGHRRGQPTLSP